MYIIACLKTLSSQQSFHLVFRFFFNWLVTAIAPATVVQEIGIYTVRWI